MAAFGLGVAAEAAPARIQFQVEPKPYAEALLDVAQQANVTLIGAGACSGHFRGRLAGAMTLEQALSQLLENAPCRWRVVAPGGVEILPPLQAEARPQPPVMVSEVLVTATKRVRNQRELAVAVTAIPRNQLQSTGSADVGEASGQLGGVLATNLGPGRNKLLLRGLSDGAYTGRARSIVATYLDDIPINYNAPDPDLRLVDVERVEVARGPQGALYGAGSLGGVYRIVARKPDLKRISAEVRGTAADTAEGAASRAIEGHINVPLWRDVAGLRLSGYDEIQGGYLDDIGQNRSDVDQTERRGARLSLYVQPNDAWSVNLTVAGQHLRSEDTHYTTPGLGLNRSVRIPEPHVNDIQLATGTVRASWGWAQFTSSTGYVRHAYGSLYDATATQLNYTSFAKLSSAYSERTRTRMLVHDMYLTSRGAGRLEWLAGVYGSDTKLSSPTQFLVEVLGVPDALVYGDTRSDRIRELAAYGELTYELAPRWTVAVGGRVFNIREHTISDVVSERFAPRHVDRNLGFTGFSPKVSLQRELAGGNLVYGVVSEGYRAGGVNSGGALPLPPQRETFAPDRLINFEVGVKLRALDNRLAINSAVFYDIWRDIQTDQFRDSGIPYTTNAGDAHILGLETELSWRDPSGLVAQVNARLSRIRTTNVNSDFTTDLVNGLPGAPAISAGGLLGYEREVFRDWTVRLIAQATYIGRSRVTFDRTRPLMGGYARTKLSAEISGQAMGAPVALQVFVINPLNDFSDTFAFGNPFNPDQVRQITPQRPRTIGVTLSAAI
ncbi:TonB-dependent receptor [uncultured Phenylobacterium sp.]|uniref:TonB-dependent receptor n=1 Tax=uncultured Phenylobacterium sp. TaxID=349273 RepID=UPI0025E84479|nr:TonB-dependent receptor [uncultured Phenylobacterium sp.]